MEKYADVSRPHLLPVLDAEARQAAELYPLHLPAAWARRIDWHNPQDPLYRQVIPSAEELRSVEGFVDDPLQEAEARRAPGLLQKYQGRVLLQVSSQCAIHCRFCFRRHETYAEQPSRPEEWTPALEWIAADPSIHEVVLSGGDPLMLAEASLRLLVERLAAIPHLRRLRIHSRVPVVSPQRLSTALLQAITAHRLTPVLVIHCNHPAELDPTVLEGLARLLRAGVLLLSQSVLLKGINDDADVLAALFETLANHRVLPYYLHLLDPVAGTAHFQVESAQALALLQQLRARLPGYAVPKLVREQAGHPAKTPVEG
ncbi:MAG: EF-P beta-lysylation protein EpmB [Magnetococcales bacterium]|nr:EF-P beta-lysylation protein EpmB [Magnetococcales bacterium]